MLHSIGVIKCSVTEFTVEEIWNLLMVYPFIVIEMQALDASKSGLKVLDV